MDEPRIGDVWHGEDNDGNAVYAFVTAVVPPVTDPRDAGFPCDWKVALDGSLPVSRAWWWGQGWTEVEE